jgi:predicted dehydrogenase
VLGVGIIGTGSIADVYVRNAALMRNYHIVAVAGRTLDRSRSRAAGWGLMALEIDQLLQHNDVDVVLNLTPPAAHHAVTKAALSAQKHVFSEKPLGSTLSEALDLAAYAAKRRLRLGVAPDSILGAGLQRAAAMIDAGLIGRPLMAMSSILYHGADSWHPNPSFFYQPGGGPAHDVGPYFLAAMITLFGPIGRVQAVGFRGSDTRMLTAEGREKGRIVAVDVLTSVLALLSFRSGVEATLTASWDVWKTSAPPLEVHGTEGSLQLPHPNFHGGPLLFAKPGGDWEPVPLGDTPLAVPNWPLEQPENCNYRGIGIAEMIDAMARDQPHRASAELGAHVVEAADAIVSSAAQASTIDLHLQPERPRHFGTEDANFLLRSSARA